MRLVRLFVVIAILVLSGCSTIDVRNPEAIRSLREPDSNREYLLYKPSSYDSKESWPLIVVCAGGFPDSPTQQLKHWTELAESRGFIVAAPTALGKDGGVSKSDDVQITSLRRDEEHIRGVVQHVRAGHNVSDDRIFIHGWSEGAGPALFAGLRNPQVFRAISIAQPKVHPSVWQLSDSAINHYQPVMLLYERNDLLTRKEGKECADQLRSRGVALRDEWIGPVKPDDTSKIIVYYEDVIRKTALIHVEVAPAEGNNLMELAFRVLSTPAPTAYRWSFGDGDESRVAEPRHIYSQPGTYRATVVVEGLPGGPHRRTVNVRVPHGGRNTSTTTNMQSTK